MSTSKLAGAWKSSTSNSYNIVIHRWCQFAERFNINKFAPSLPELADYYLYRAFSCNDTYKMFATARSALSFLIQELFAEQQSNNMLKLVARSIFAHKPPIPKSDPVTWDINVVLHFWSKNPENKDLTLYNLSRKTASLLMLATLRRQRKLIMMTTDRCVIQATGLEFKLSKPVKNYNCKTYKDNPHLLTVFVPGLVEDKKLCPVHTLQHYILRTQSFRTDGKFFIRTTDPFMPVTSATFRQWLISTLSDSGIDTQKFRAHSYHHSSSSASFSKGTPLDVVVAQGGWLSATTFVTMYLKNIVPKYFPKQEQQWCQIINDRISYFNQNKKPCLRNRFSSQGKVTNKLAREKVARAIQC